MTSFLDDIDNERILHRGSDPTAPEEMCRVHLSKQWVRPVILAWCAGHNQGNMNPPARETRLIVNPGKSVEQPLSKVRAWFGPFDLYEKYATMEDSPTREMLRSHIALETARAVLRYDWPKGNGRGYHPDMMPVGHNRMPDVSITVLDPEGNHPEPIRIYQLYKLGEFDPLKDTFVAKKTQAELAAEYEEDLRKRDHEASALRRELAELRGEFAGAVKGAVAVATAKEKVANGREPVAAGK
jgi:hypothetical protein